MSEAWKVDIPKISLKTLTKGSVMLLATPHQREQLAIKANGQSAPRGTTALERRPVWCGSCGGRKKFRRLPRADESTADLPDARPELRFGDGIELVGLPGEMHGDLSVRQARSGCQLRTGRRGFQFVEGT
jgi:hypothetical protein